MTLFQGLPSRLLHHSLILSTLLAVPAMANGQAIRITQGSPDPGLSYPQLTRPRPQSTGVAGTGNLWPQVGGVATVYYQINGASGDVTNINAAITQFNADFPGVIQWVNSTGSGNYAEFNLSTSDTSGTCEAYVGYQATPAQPVTGSASCDESTILHEMGHVIGLWHEMTRSDRDSYVTVNYNNVVKADYPGNFLINTENQQNLTTYFDYASLMQYPSMSFSRNGGPVIESIPAGIPMNIEGDPVPTTPDYSAADKEGILRLYGAAPTKVTITSNPVGLQVNIDGTPYTTPASFPVTGLWALGTTHTLDVPTGVQTLTGYIANSTTSSTFNYTYGRWNDSTSQSHTITVTAGDGSPLFPRTSPQVATYTANFIQLVRYAPTVSPSGSGSVSVSPSAQAYSDTNSNPLGNFLVARENVTLTATPNSGWNFYQFNSNYPYFWLPGGLSANPKELFVPDSGNPMDQTVAYFSPTSDPIYTINVALSQTMPNEFALNWYVGVDVSNNGTYYLVPKNFSAYYDAGGSGTPPAWTTGSTHDLTGLYSPAYPLSSNTRYVFNNWSDGGALSHTTAPIPATSTNYTATFDPQFEPATGVNATCGGSVGITPTSGDGFYPWGQSLTFTASPNTNWNFTGWNYDLLGTTNPDSLTADDETLVYANFNTSTDPFTFTGISPSSAHAGSGQTTLTLTGTGFDSSNSHVYLGNTLLTSNYVSATELQATVTAAEVANPATYGVYLENFPNGATCAAIGGQTFTVTGAMITPTITWTPAGSIIFGDAGTKVLNATANAPGSFAYSATPTGGGSSVVVTGGTQNLTAGSWDITATFTPTDPSTYTTAQTTRTVIVSGESVWIVNSGGGTAELAGNGYGISSSAFPSADAAISIDSAGNVWTAGAGPLLEETSQVGTVQNTINSGGGLNAPAGIAIDGLSQVWVTNGNGSVSEFSGAAAVSPASGYTDPSLSTPTGVAIDLGGSVWIANKGNNSVTRILGAAAPVAPLSTAAKNKTTGTRP